MQIIFYFDAITEMGDLGGPEKLHKYPSIEQHSNARNLDQNWTKSETVSSGRFRSRICKGDQILDSARIFKVRPAHSPHLFPEKLPRRYANESPKCPKIRQKKFVFWS